MSLRLYLDDCAYSRRLRQLLREAGHDVETPADLVPPLLGADDATHFAHAQAAGRTILTLNARDFQALHDQNAAHAGILVIYQDNDPSKACATPTLCAPSPTPGRTVHQPRQWQPWAR